MQVVSYLGAPRRRGLGRRRLGRRGLGARIAASPCSSVSFAPSLRPFFGAGPAKTWCTNRRKPLLLLFFCTKSQICLAPGPSKLAPGSRRSLCPSSDHANIGAFDPEDVVLDDERIRVCVEGRTTFASSRAGQPLSLRSACHPAHRIGPRPARRSARRPGARTGPPAGGLFLRLCFSSICKKGIMKWPDWREADSGKGKGQETSNL